MTKASKSERESAIYVLPETISVLRPFRGSKAEEVYRAAKEIEKKHKGFPGLENYFEFNKETGEINGSNLAHLVALNEALAKEGLRTVTVEELRELDQRGLITNGVYRDLGLVVYSAEKPNEEVAKKIVAEAKSRGWQLPVIAHPASLSFGENGVYDLREDTSLVHTGQDARNVLETLDYKTDFGAHGLGRSRYGDWDAYWYGVADSCGDGRVDWVRGKATRAEFKENVTEKIRSLADSL